MTQKEEEMAQIATSGQFAGERLTGAHGAAAESSYVHTVIVLLVFVAMNFGGYFTVKRFLPVDFVIIPCLGYITFERRFHIRLNGPLFLFFVFYFMVFAMMAASIIVIDGGSTENIAPFVGHLRNGALVYLIAQLDYDHERLGRWIVLAGAVFSLIAIAAYIYGVMHPEAVEQVTAEELWRERIFFVSEKGLIRLQGLREDPNLYCFINFIPLLFGIFMLRVKKSFRLFLLTGIIFTGMWLTFSRSGLALLALFMFILFFDDIAKAKVKRFFMIFLAIVAIAIGSHFVSYRYDLPYAEDYIVARFARGAETGGSGRAELWGHSWDGFKKSVIFGNGGRYTDRTYGRSGHNDYLDLLADYGLIGFTLVMAMWGYVVLFVVSSSHLRRRSQLFTCCVYLFFYMLMAGFFYGLFLKQFAWFPVALLLSVKDDA